MSLNGLNKEMLNLTAIAQSSRPVAVNAAMLWAIVNARPCNRFGHDLPPFITLSVVSYAAFGDNSIECRVEGKCRRCGYMPSKFKPWEKMS